MKSRAALGGDVARSRRLTRREWIVRIAALLVALLFIGTLLAALFTHG